MAEYTIVKDGSTYQVIRSGNTLVASYVASNSDPMRVYDWDAAADLANWNGADAGPTVATFDSMDQGQFSVIDDATSAFLASWNGSDAGTPIGGTGATSAFYMPSSAADLQAKLQAALDNGKTLLTSPDMRLDVPDTINLTLKDVGGYPHGWVASGGVLNWTGNDPTKSVVKLTMAGPQNYNLELDGIYVNGGWATGLQCRAGLELSIDNSIGSVYQFKFNDFGAGFCSGVGLWIEGGIFEGLVAFPMIKSCGDGVVLAMGQPGGPQGILSNVSLLNSNIRACTGWGIRGIGAKSVMVVGGGSLISNAAGAITSDLGFKKIEGMNIEACPGGITLGGASDAGVVVMNVDGSNTAGNMPKLINYTGAPASLQVIGCTMFNGNIQ